MITNVKTKALGINLSQLISKPAVFNSGSWTDNSKRKFFACPQNHSVLFVWHALLIKLIKRFIEAWQQQNIVLIVNSENAAFRLRLSNKVGK